MDIDKYTNKGVSLKPALGVASDPYASIRRRDSYGQSHAIKSSASNILIGTSVPSVLNSNSSSNPFGAPPPPPPPPQPAAQDSLNPFGPPPTHPEPVTTVNRDTSQDNLYSYHNSPVETRPPTLPRKPNGKYGLK